MKNLIRNLKVKRRLIAILARFHFFGNPSKKLKIVGVTGTNGKTTTATVLYEVATALGYKAGLIGTVDNIIVKERRPAFITTPSPLNLNRLLKEMLSKNCEYVFMEISSHAMDQNRVAGINFTGGIFTNLTHDHLDYHKSFENYFMAKKKFFKILPKNAFAITNIDDEYGKKILKGIKARKFSYGFQICENVSLTHFHGEIKKLDFNGLELNFNDEKINSKLLGKFNAYNLLAVWSVCKLLGFNMEKVKEILKIIKPPKGRFEYFISSNKVLIVIDYAHTPDALEKIILTLQNIKSKEGKLILIFGCGGDRDNLKRSIMGKIGASFSDIAIFTTDNPRNEDPDKIIDKMKSSLSSEEMQKVLTISNRHLAIKESVRLAKSGDIILCVGKGHENYQEIKGVRKHFDDMEEFQKLLN